MKLICEDCNITFSTKFNFKRHLKSKHNINATFCPLCNIICQNMSLHFTENHQTCNFCHKKIYNNFKKHINSCNKCAYTTFKFIGESVTHEVEKTLRLNQLPIKWILVRRVKFIKYSVNKINQTVIDKKTVNNFRSYTMLTISKREIDSQIEESFSKIDNSIQSFQSQGSGWIFDKTIHWQLYVYKYKPLPGKSYIPTPKYIKFKHAVLNIRNVDNKCFLWCILAKLYPRGSRDHANQVFYYKKFEECLNMTGIKYPVKISDIDKFEKQNNISVNVFGVENGKTIYPLRITKTITHIHVNLLLLQHGRKTHYCLIRDFDKLMLRSTKYDHKKYYCYLCLQRFTYKQKLETHLELCKNFEPQHVVMSKKKTLKFTNYKYQIKAPFVIYADFECFINDEHIPSGFAFIVVRDGLIIHEEVYSNKNVMDVFFYKLFEIYKYLKSEMSVNIPLTMTLEDEIVFQSAINCHICNKPLLLNKVRDHCHMTGQFKGAAHNECNLNYKITKKIPVIFHNLKNYDGHLIMQHLGKFKEGHRLNCVPKDMEKYISFSIDNLVFLDSYNFLALSLDKLAANLDSFKFVDHPLLQRKGVFPYEYFDGPDKFLETFLPPIEEFYSSLTKQHISTEDYLHALQVWDTFNIKNLKEYHDLYLKTDVYLLADVFEKFRELCLRDYKLDPVHMLSLPSFTWEACLYKTQVELELFQDIDMQLFIESGIRGGVSMISTRYARANNKYMKEHYNPSLESVYLVYLDCNALYSTAMCKPLPVNEFHWTNETDYLTNTNEEYGFILEVDLKYDKSLHDLHNDYPLAPEKINGKLIPNLKDKTKYILHYKTLQKYEELGLVVTKYYRILKFKQSEWLAPYINFNNEKRKLAQNDFEKDFYKLLNNSLFGRTIMNQRKFKNIYLVDELKLTKYVSKPHFDCSKKFDNNLHAVHMKKLIVKLDKPIYLGMTILDISKVIMYDFHYNYMSKFKNKKFLMTDTDSLMYSIVTDDFYKEIEPDIDYFDTSAYSKDHFLYSENNKKIMGKFKDELNGCIMYEYCGLRPKLYSYIPLQWLDNHDIKLEIKKAKGADRATIKHLLRHQHYLNCLNTKEDYFENVTRIQSVNHHLKTVNTMKKVLSFHDDKRYILEDGINTIALGHYKIDQT